MNWIFCIYLISSILFYFIYFYFIFSRTDFGYGIISCFLIPVPLFPAFAYHPEGFAELGWQSDERMHLCLGPECRKEVKCSIFYQSLQIT